MSLVSGGISAVAEWTTTLFSKFSSEYVILISMITISIIYRFLLKPLFGGSGGSDRAKKKKSQQTEES